MKMGLGTYNADNGTLLASNQDINCTDGREFCSTMRWKDASWDNGNVTGMSEDPPQKDTIVVPTGGYVVVRFISDNPGMWFLHCHIDLHNTGGMGMVIDEGDTKPTTPLGFPECRNFEFKGFPTTTTEETSIATRFRFGVENILALGLVSIWVIIQL